MMKEIFAIKIGKVYHNISPSNRRSTPKRKVVICGSNNRTVNTLATRFAINTLPSQPSLYQSPAKLAQKAEPSRHSGNRPEEHTSELQSRENLVCRLLLEKKKPYP